MAYRASSLPFWLLALMLLQAAPCESVPFHPPSLQAQEGYGKRFEESRENWASGRFVDALQTLEGLLSESPTRDLLDRIALLTGELFPVRELTSDGRAVRWSPDGRFAAYESGSEPETTTHVLAVTRAGAAEVASVDGAGLAFSPSSERVAYLAVPESPALLEARARVREAFGGDDRTSRMRLRAETARLEAEHTVVRVRDLGTGEERSYQPAELAVRAPVFGPDGSLYLLGNLKGEGDVWDVYRLGEDGAVAKITRGPGQKTDPFFAGGGGHLVFGAGRGSFGVLHLADGEARTFSGSAPVLSADGTSLAYLGEDERGSHLIVLDLSPSGISETFNAPLPFPVSTSSSRACAACPLQGGLALAPDGGLVAVQAMPREDWEIVTVSTSGEPGEVALRQVTREIQHDLYPMMLADGRLLAVKGEARHRRAYLYDLESGEAIWLFRNNTVRTVAPEYEWAPSPDGTGILFVAERDGNTVSPERGVYLMDLTRKVGQEELLARVRRNLAAEEGLLAQAQHMFGPVAEEVEAAVGRISTARIFHYEEALFKLGSKHVTQPGNGLAIEYLTGKLREFGYEPELQWFDARGVRSANVIARIPGAVSPEVVYAVSAHFDSNTRSPGADDNTSATVGLLEMARVLAGQPLPATIEIAFFTGEESGLLGSREYVRRAVESGKKLVGALNNDMVGYSEDHRLDNTIRYSNAGIRDLQHGAAILFSEMVTHDAEYYKSTDAAAYYDAFGDIVGGIGSYPILASPHYHQSHDVLETVNHRLVTEVARMSTASIMLMASVPSRILGLKAVRRDGTVEVSWTPALETDVVKYRVAFGPEDDPFRTLREVDRPALNLGNLPAGIVVAVKAVNDRDLEGWDWARIEIER